MFLDKKQMGRGALAIRSDFKINMRSKCILDRLNCILKYFKYFEVRNSIVRVFSCHRVIVCERLMRASRLD